jgi:hypothetical protein
MAKVLRTGARLYFAPRSALGLAFATVLGFTAALLVVAVLIAIMRPLVA